MSYKNSHSILQRIPNIYLYTTTLFIIATLLSYFYSYDYYLSLIKEDGWVENWTALTLGISGIIVLKYFLSYKSNYILIARLIVLFTGTGLLFACGEEISWGQRLFDINSGEYFAQNNLQGETNLHNLKIHGVELNKVIFTYGLTIIFSVYFLLLRPLYSKFKLIKNTVDQFRIPVPYYRQVFYFIILTIATISIQHDKKWELWECIFAITIFWIIIKSYNNIYKRELS